MKIPQVHKLSMASQLSLLAIVILIGAVFFTVNSAMQQQNQASHASGATNILLNPSFESGTTNWHLNVTSPGAGSFSTTTSSPEDGAAAAQVKITGSTSSNSGSWWYVQLQELNLPMTAGQKYTVSFWAKASSNRQISSVVQSNSSPYAVYGDNYPNLTTSWQQYSFTFTAPVSSTNVFVGFNLASATGTVWIDNVSYAQTNAAPTTIPVLTIQPTDIIVPTAAPTPTPTPASVPTVTVGPSATSTPTTPVTTVTPVPSISYAPGSTLLNLTVGLQGIGTGGDSANPNSDGNMNPLRPTRTVTLDVYDAQNELAVSQLGTITYNSSTGKFNGTVNLGPEFATGLYTVKVKTDQYLRAIVPGIQTITQGQVNSIPTVTLVAGDINGDNEINIVDYNILIGCYSDLLPAVDCTAANNVLADLNDDGHVNEFDYNLFLRELTNIGGQ